ncbi:hypothetical protein [Methylobacterium sp. J-067]|uniref:hypothetical protein n=1 Tax=Methylobacterium sp. J-067 TaxID=2836648 RepID=UPI001FBB3AB1|nr:hypothetical protein [Methylobacterium sp. J-067]MCJ2023438.1 hypothetical protein [Methylobacterium sp. J-067]
MEDAMTHHRIQFIVRSASLIALIGLGATAMGPLQASAKPLRVNTHILAVDAPLEPAEAAQTGSLPVSTGLRDVAHIRRSSALGNAEFPEREPIGMHFGNTTGGGFE